MKRTLVVVAAAAGFGVLALSAGVAHSVAVPGGTAITICQTITQPGAYFLAKNLTAGLTGHCLVIAADHVTIDFNGYRIKGNGSGDCVRDSGSREGIVLKNGTVTGCFEGINLGNTDACKIEEMRVLENNSTGIHVADRCLIKNNVVADNDGTGILGEDRTVILQNVVVDNGSNGFDGINVDDESVIEQNLVQSNGNSDTGDGHGIHTCESAVIKNNVCSDNADDGIFVACRGSVIIANSCMNNGDDGIHAGETAAVHFNSADNNGGDGFDISSPCSMTGNVARSNDDCNYNCGCVTETNAGSGGDCIC